jgi:hypothetical protein
MVKQETSLTFYGGINEIGGNQVLLEDRGTRIFLDSNTVAIVLSKKTNICAELAKTSAN